jgi:hypothetical protein
VIGFTSENPEDAVSKEGAVFHMAEMVDSESSSNSDRIEDRGKPARISLNSVEKLTVFCICSWSVAETPLEIAALNTSALIVALAVSKLLVLVIGICTIARVRAAHAIFALICGTGVLAIVPSLPFVYTQSGEIGVISTLECLLKAAYLGALCLSSLRKRQRNRVDRADSSRWQNQSRFGDVRS